MTSLADTERLRARWRRALQRHALDTVTRDDFALSGIAARFKAPTVQLLALPEDPEAEALHLDEALWTWLETQKCVDVENRAIRFGDRKCPTPHAAVLVDGHGTQPWNNYLAVHRSGAIELGFGNRGGWERPNQKDEPIRVFNLISIVTYTWAALKFGAAHFGRLPGIGPWQLTLAVRGTEGALLGISVKAGRNLSTSSTRRGVAASIRTYSGISNSRTGPTRKVGNGSPSRSVIDLKTHGESANAVTSPTAASARDVSTYDVSPGRRTRPAPPTSPAQIA